MRSSMGTMWRRLICLMPLLAGLPVAPANADQACGQPGDIVWKEQFGTADEDVARSVAVDAAGNIAVVGYTRGNLFGSNQGGRDGFIISLTPDGSPRWQRQFGRADDDYAEAVALDPAGGFVVFGDTTSSTKRFFDVLLRRYAANGSLSWKSQFGSPNAEYVLDGAVDAAGNLFVAGTARSTDSDALLLKLTPRGDVTWTRLIGTKDPYSSETGYAVAIDSTGRAIVAGITSGAVAGANRGSMDPFVAKYASDGRPQWKRQFGSSEFDYAWDVATDTDDSVILAGETGWPSRGYVVKYNRTGARQWWLQLPRVHPYTVAVSSENEIYVAGEGGDNGGGMWVGKVAAAGQLLWGRTYEGAYARADGIAIEPAGTGRLVVVGETQYDFAGVNQGGEDAWAAVICR